MPNFPSKIAFPLSYGGCLMDVSHLGIVDNTALRVFVVLYFKLLPQSLAQSGGQQSGEQPMTAHLMAQWLARAAIPLIDFGQYESNAGNSAQDSQSDEVPNSLSEHLIHY
jgi:hypothetical protein